VLNLKIFAEAALTLAPDWLGEFVLLLNSLHEHVAYSTAEGANLQLGLHFSRARYCALDRHDLAETERLEVSNLVDGGHVVDSDLEPL